MHAARSAHADNSGGVQVLVDIGCAARAHDQTGLLQMPPQGVPGLGDVAHVLLYAYALLDTFIMVRSHDAVANDPEMVCGPHLTSVNAAPGFAAARGS